MITPVLEKKHGSVVDEMEVGKMRQGDQFRRSLN